MDKRKSELSNAKKTLIVTFITGYLIFCAWWQYTFVYPFIKEGDYWNAFGVFMGLNPLYPFWGYVLGYIIIIIVGWLYRIRVFLFGEK